MFNNKKTMRKSKKKLVIILIVVILMLAAICSSNVMFRVAVFRYSPISAVTMEYYKSENNEGEELYIITENAPVEEATQDTLITWKVSHFGPVKIVKYYGEV